MRMVWSTAAVLQLLSCVVFVRGAFVLKVKFISYTNPSGLCAECNTTLTTPESLAHIVPVCCDESPFKTDNCDNTGEARCDTRFRWIIRTFGGSLETRPPSALPGEPPVYNYSPCGFNNSFCPFSEMSKTFELGELAFLGQRNPTMVYTTEPWTGRTQFYLEAVESGLPNIIDSFLINFDNLQLGADFTEEMTFTGHHNISHMTMSFKVECAPNYCGSGCTTEYLNDPVFTCQPDGSIVCTNSLRDLSTNCMGCLQGRDPVTNCTQCLPGFNTSTNCTTCLQPGYDPDNDCTQCLPNRDPDTNCTSCLFGNSGDSCSPGTDVNAVIGGTVAGVILLLLMVMLMTVGIVVCERYKISNKRIGSKDDDDLEDNVCYNMTTRATNEEDSISTEQVLLNESSFVEATSLSVEPNLDLCLNAAYQTAGDQSDCEQLYENQGVEASVPDYDYVLVDPSHDNRVTIIQ